MNFVNPFDAFLHQIDFDPLEAENATHEDYITGKHIENESVNKFKSMTNAPPSLLSLSVFAVCSNLNQKACRTEHFESVREYWNNHIKILPGNLYSKIKSQCSFSTLCCIYQDQVWDEDPAIVAASIKQEEDMLRYLYWKDPTNPLLRHFEQTLLIQPLKGKYFDMLCQPATPLTDTLQNSAVFNPAEREPSTLVDENTFKTNWQKFSKGLLKGMDWSNVLVVGGSVLSSMHKTPNYSLDSDIDVYFYDISREVAQQKVEEIYRLAQSKWPEPVGMTKTANTVTIISRIDWYNAEKNFVNIQIILSTYASPLEILLSSDMNSCSVAFDGERVIAIPRFILGMKYRANFLDSSTKFGPKLRWERLSKYYQRGFDIVAPLQLRVHGHGSLASVDTIAKSHPNTVQLIELMSLLKLRLMCITHETVTFGLNREDAFFRWHIKWTAGVHCSTPNNGPARTTVVDDLEQLKEQYPTPPPWVLQYYETHQKLLMSTAVREPPRYSDTRRNLNELWTGENFVPPTDPDKCETQLKEYIQKSCRFDLYNESSLQCFHLNLLVNKELKSSNPYCDMNTSLVNMNYHMDTVMFEFDNFKDFLFGEIQTLEKRFQLFNRNWKFTLTYGNDAIVFMSLTKEEDEATTEYNKVAMLGTNFLITLIGQQTVVFDRSHIFTDEEPHNTWLTWVHKHYLTEFTEWHLTLQMIEPSFDITIM